MIVHSLQVNGCTSEERRTNDSGKEGKRRSNKVMAVIQLNRRDVSSDLNNDEPNANRLPKVIVASCCFEDNVR